MTTFTRNRRKRPQSQPPTLSAPDPRHPQRVNREFLATLCALSGHIGHERDCFNQDGWENKNGGWWCVPVQEWDTSTKKVHP